MHKLNFPVARIGCFLQSTHTFVFIWNQGKNIIPRNKIAKLDEFLAEHGKKFTADDDMAIQAQNTGQKSFNSPIDFE